MSVLVIGLSHHTAPLSLLEAAAATDPAVLAAQVRASDAIGEVVVVSTCNRLEVYAESLTFHGAVASIGEVLGAAAGVSIGDLSSHLYVHFEDRAVAHAFSVACGLDSMAVGEAQVLGQFREALRTAQRGGTAGPSLNSLFQQALRVGKRAHAETAIDRVSHSLVEAGLEAAAEILGPLTGAHVLVVGAGGMSSLAATTVARRGVARLTVVNRTEAKAHRLAATLAGTLDVQARPLADLQAALAPADLVITSTGSLGYLVTAAQVVAARAERADDRAAVPAGAVPVGRQVFLDLALPRDVEPEVATLHGVSVIGLDDLGARLAGDAATSSLPEVRAVTDLVTAEVAAYLTGRMEQAALPTVAALRSRAHEVVDAEMARLDQKLPDIDPATRAEMQRTVHRIVEKLLHKPTVRIKELTSEGHGGDYAAALRELFDLDPYDVAAVSVPPARPAVPGTSGAAGAAGVGGGQQGRATTESAGGES